MNIDKNDLSNIGNTDETSIYLDMINDYTWNTKGEKNIRIKSFGKEKIRIKVMPTILADGTKLPLFFVVKGNKGKRKEKTLHNNEYVKKGLAFVYSQDNAWVYNQLFLNYLEDIWFNEKTNSNLFNRILIIDRATTHFNENNNKIFSKYKNKYCLIPAGCTYFLQPLDVAINKPLKDCIKEEIKNIKNLSH